MHTQLKPTTRFEKISKKRRGGGGTFQLADGFEGEPSRSFEHVHDFFFFNSRLLSSKFYT